MTHHIVEITIDDDVLWTYRIEGVESSGEAQRIAAEDFQPDTRIADPETCPDTILVMGDDGQLRYA